MALVPKTANAAKVLRSAWIPAPPPLSDPAMVRAIGISKARMIYTYLGDRSSASARLTGLAQALKGILRHPHELDHQSHEGGTCVQGFEDGTIAL